MFDCPNFEEGIVRVAFISFDFPEYSVRWASALAHEADVLLLLPRQYSEPYWDLLDPAVDFRPFDPARLRQPLRQFRMIRELVRTIDQFAPDVIHFQHRHMWFNFALPFLKKYPLVITIHDPIHHIGDRSARVTPQWIADFGYRRADQVVVHGEQLKQTVIRRFGVSDETVHIVPHIVLGTDNSGGSVVEDDHLILFFGRIWEYKGLEYLIRAEPLITDKIPEARIVIAGCGEDFDRYRRMMVHPEQFIVHYRYVPDEERTELFQRASVVVLPYIEASQSGVIPLAYTFSKPVVTTSVGGLPDMVEDGRTGYVVPPRDETALAEAIVHLLQDKALRHRFGAAGKRKIDTECSPAAIARQSMDIYRRAVNGKPKFARQRV